MINRRREKKGRGKHVREIKEKVFRDEK